MTPEPPSTIPTTKTNAGAGCLVAIVLLIGGCWFIARPDNSPEAQARRSLSSARAITATICEASVKDRLKSPGSADFPFGHVADVTAIDSNRYRLESFVDSQNGFGALIRTRFTCVIDGSGEQITGYRLFRLDLQ